MVDESVKFAWAYLLTHGKVTNGNWSYYGGCWEEKTRSIDWNNYGKDLQEIKDKAVKIGIDWKKSGIPEVSEQDIFNGTFASHQGKCLGTLGRLVLKNGEEHLIGSSDNDAAHLAETARNLMRGKSDPVNILAQKL